MVAVNVNAAITNTEMRSLFGAMLGTIEGEADAMTFVWQPQQGRVALWRDGESVAAHDVPARPGGDASISFGQLDGRLFFVLDRRRDALFVVPRDRTAASPPPRYHLYVAVAGESHAAIGTVRVYRDVYATRDPIPGGGGWPRRVLPGTWFLLGDNAFDSRDSRQLQKPVPTTSFLGVPRCVIGPWPRMRWLP
jgi:hypothetical protein